MLEKRKMNYFGLKPRVSISVIKKHDNEKRMHSA